MKKKKKVLLVVDGTNVLYRGYYATPKLTSDAGVPTNAIMGLVTIIMADIKRVGATHVAVVFDRPGKNFRHALYPEYKGTRVKDDTLQLHLAIPLAKKLLNASGINVFGRKNVEGDDIIGSLGYKFRDLVHRAYISSNDKDFAALVDDKLHLLKPKGVIVDEAGVLAQFGVRPDQMVEYLMLLGDKVDNIPGVDKCGPATAAKWLSTHGTLKAISREAKFTPVLGKNFAAARKQFSLTRKLIKIDLSQAEGVTLPHLRLRGLQPEFEKICKQLSLTRTRSEILNTLG